MARVTFTGSTKAPKFKGYVYSELTSALSGPFASKPISAMSSVTNSSEMVSVDDDLNVYKTDLNKLRETDFSAAPSTLWDDKETAADTSAYGVVVASETTGSFSYRGRYLSSPFAEAVKGSGSVVDPYYFRDSYLSIAETNWMHLGDEHNEKQVHRLDFSFHKNSTGHLWAYVESDEGKVKGQYKGLLGEHEKVFVNIRGRRFRVRMFVVGHSSYPWALREIGVGHLYGKSF